MSDDGPRTTAIVFPFDLFGSPGAGAGAALLGDELREVLADNRRETVPTRAAAYSDRLRLREFTFETLADYEGWRRRGRQAVRQVLRRGDFLLWLAGNHLGALPLYDELSALGERCLVVQLDAHLDIHDFAGCTSELSHGNFLLHCAGPLPPVVNVGHRELLLRPEHVARHYRLALPAELLALDPDRALAAVRDASRRAERVFLDIDCDVFDPAFFPAVGQPVPFGLSPQQLLRCLDAAWSERVAGVAVSEFDPGRDQDDRSLATLVWLLEYLLLRRCEAA
ncbi:MAG TPA: arginase family protein [Gemmataceae bacterium]|nr:arginase family protein [Gemmataceae bacterium]